MRDKIRATTGDSKRTKVSPKKRKEMKSVSGHIADASANNRNGKGNR